MSVCIVTTCKNNMRNVKQISDVKVKFYKLPKNKMAKKWLLAAGVTKCHLKDPRICSIHFEEKYFFKDQIELKFGIPAPKNLRNISKDAVPTLHLPERAQLEDSEDYDTETCIEEMLPILHKKILNAREKSRRKQKSPFSERLENLMSDFSHLQKECTKALTAKRGVDESCENIENEHDYSKDPRQILLRKMEFFQKDLKKAQETYNDELVEIHDPCNATITGLKEQLEESRMENSKLEKEIEDKNHQLKKLEIISLLKWEQIEFEEDTGEEQNIIVCKQDEIDSYLPQIVTE